MRIFITLICLLTFALPSWADVVMTTETQYYNVDGSTKNEILRNLKKQSPIIINGKKFHGFTRAKTRYEFAWNQKGNTCTLKKATVFIHIIYQYPKLSRKPKGSTLRWWELHMDGLKKHELIHGKIALDGAHELDKELNNMKKLNCTTAKSKIKAVANHIFQHTRQEQVAYDKLTEHGKKQNRYKAQ